LNSEFPWTDFYGDRCKVYADVGGGDFLEIEVSEDGLEASGTMDRETALKFYDWLGRILYPNEFQKDRP
jgi:hypothetical protein